FHFVKNYLYTRKSRNSINNVKNSDFILEGSLKNADSLYQNII
ncbi:unnamed protein product, partial [marine sediment metagenome]